MDRSPSFGIVLLAAGGSTRMGRPKQLLLVDGEPLVRRVARACTASAASAVVVVLGKDAPEVSNALAGLAVHLLVHPKWASGMGGSLSQGLQELERIRPQLDGALIALCDQPAFGSDTVARLVRAFEPPGTIACARYREAVGAPALFGREFFSDLLALDPSAGAQKVLKSRSDRLRPVDLPELALDLDTPGDYRRYLSREGP